MAAASIYKLAEKVYNILQRGDMQALISSCIDCYGTIAKREFYENKQNDYGEVDGVFLYNFGKDGSLVPVLDTTVDMYYIVMPSSYLRLPCEYGINSVSFIKGRTKPFVRVGAGSIGMWSGLLASVMGGHQTYFIEQDIVDGGKMWFPKMTATSAGPIMTNLAIALDNVDPEQELNIPPNIQDMIVNMMLQKFQSKPDAKPETLQ